VGGGGRRKGALHDLANLRALTYQGTESVPLKENIEEGRRVHHETGGERGSHARWGLKPFAEMAAGREVS